MVMVSEMIAQISFFKYKDSKKVVSCWNC